MPELPEVETIVNELKPLVEGKRDIQEKYKKNSDRLSSEHFHSTLTFTFHCDISYLLKIS
jgi:formamidopyrimidine-DNA glycosylase